MGAKFGGGDPGRLRFQKISQKITNSISEQFFKFFAKFFILNKNVAIFAKILGNYVLCQKYWKIKKFPFRNGPGECALPSRRILQEYLLIISGK